MLAGIVEAPGCRLAWSLMDLTPPWTTPRGTIVMHHGIGADRHIFDLWLPRLLPQWRVLRFDMRGHGESGRPERSVPLDLDRLSDDLLAVMDCAGVTRGHVVGESIGGTVALHTALRAPERVMTLTISNGAHKGGSIESVSGWRRMIEGEGMDAWSAFMMQGRFFEGAIPPGAWRWFKAQQATACPGTVLRMLEALVGADLTPRLDRLAPPLMILHPDSSPFIPVAVVAELRGLVPAARLHVIGGARHGLPFSHAEQCAALLEDFLSGSSVRG